MGIEMDYSMETPLDVLSRAALMVQNEEREAALKRSGESRQACSQGSECEQPCKRLRASPPAPPPYPTHASTTAHYATHTTYSSASGMPSPHSVSSSSHQSAAGSATQSSSQPSASRHSPPPWQPFTTQPAPHPHFRLASLPVNTLAAPRTEGPGDASNVPLNLSVTSRAQASLPSASVIAQARAHDSSSPGVPENLTGRRVVNQNGLVFCPTPVHGASLPNMEAKTYRDVDSDTCDPAIEEHFRRSLGSAYMECMSTSSRASSASPRTPTPPGEQPAARATPADNRVKLVSVSGTVDEHFAKALGKQTWKQIKYQSEEADADQSRGSDSSSVDEHFTKALGAHTWHKIKQDHMAPPAPASGHAHSHGDAISANSSAVYYRGAPTPTQ